MTRVNYRNVTGKGIDKLAAVLLYLPHVTPEPSFPKPQLAKRHSLFSAGLQEADWCIEQVAVAPTWPTPWAPTVNFQPPGP